jgi:micrococcal nuclease
MAWVEAAGPRSRPKRGPWNRPGARPWHKIKVKRRGAWLRDAALAALVGMAAGGYIGITGDGPGKAGVSVPSSGSIGINQGGPRAGVSVPGSGHFPHCGRANQQNCVIDGDTIRYGGVKVRLADIDAPEVFSPKCASEAALGQRATQRLVDVMNAGPFEMVRTGRDKDIYGRKLRVIERGGRSVADTLVTEGLARRWDGARRSWCG